MDSKIHREDVMLINNSNEKRTIGEQIGESGMLNIENAIKEIEAYNLKQYLLQWLKENETT